MSSNIIQVDFPKKISLREFFENPSRFIQAPDPESLMPIIPKSIVLSPSGKQIIDMEIVREIGLKDAEHFLKALNRKHEE